MKVFFWIYTGLFLLLTPLFIYDMYVERQFNFTVIILFILLFTFYDRAYKGKNAGKEEK